MQDRESTKKHFIGLIRQLESIKQRLWLSLVATGVTISLSLICLILTPSCTIMVYPVWLWMNFLATMICLVTYCWLIGSVTK